MEQTPAPGPRTRSWPEAFAEFVKDEKMGLVPKIALRYIPAAYIPFGIANDVVLPGIGIVDNAPTLFLAAYVLWRVNKYRRIEP